MPLPLHAAPGIELDDLHRLPSSSDPVYISCIDYCPDQFAVEEVAVEELPAFLERHRPAWSVVRWINIDGLTNMTVIGALAQKYSLHPLAIEDLLRLGQRPHVDPYHAEGNLQARLFLIMKMVQLSGEHVKTEQISMFVGHSTILTFQEDRGDVWDPIRERIRKPGSRIRKNDASFLVYTLIDATHALRFPLCFSKRWRAGVVDAGAAGTEKRGTDKSGHRTFSSLSKCPTSVQPPLFQPNLG